MTKHLTTEDLRKRSQMMVRISRMSGFTREEAQERLTPLLDAFMGTPEEGLPILLEVIDEAYSIPQKRMDVITEGFLRAITPEVDRMTDGDVIDALTALSEIK